MKSEVEEKMKSKTGKQVFGMFIVALALINLLTVAEAARQPKTTVDEF